MEIILLIAGGIIFILSFFIPDRKPAPGKGDSAPEGARALAGEEIKTLVSQEVNSIREHVDGVVEEAVNYAMEKTERSLERLSNEKIMAVSEYSDTVLKEIHKNHEEAMFLYDMLNNKHINLKNTVSEVNRTVKEAEETVMSFQKLTPEAVSVKEEKILETRVEPAVKPEPEKPRQERSGLEKPRLEKSVVTSGDTISEKVSFLQDANEQEGRNNNERILELFKQGKSTVAIARELGLGVGEVKLVIDLFKNQ